MHAAFICEQILFAHQFCLNRLLFSYEFLRYFLSRNINTKRMVDEVGGGVVTFNWVFIFFIFNLVFIAIGVMNKKWSVLGKQHGYLSEY